MNISYRTEAGRLYIALHGRIDAANAAQVQDEIAVIRAKEADKQVVLDAEALSYISSAGLRVILRLLKEQKSLSLINACPEVYSVLDMSGFTEMLHVEKALRRMCVEGCAYLAKGANGAVYRYDDETIIKVYYSPNALPGIRQERENARLALVMGINTAIPYDIVRVGEGYGSVTELLEAQSLSQLICETPEDLSGPVQLFVQLLRTIHSTRVEPGRLPDARKRVLGWVEDLAGHLPGAQIEKLRRLVREVPTCDTMLHGDFHTGNVMVQNGEALLIDMDDLCLGHPVFELAFMFNAFLGFSEVDHTVIEEFLGVPREVAGRFWQQVLKSYLQTGDEAFCRAVEKKAMVVGYARILRRSLRHKEDALSPARVALSKQRLGQLLAEVDSLLF